MKVRDSGMPEETMWSKFFDPDLILQQMEVTNDLHLSFPELQSTV